MTAAPSSCPVERPANGWAHAVGPMAPDEETLSRAAELAQLMLRFVNCDAFSLTAWDPLSGTHRHIPLASGGYSRATVEHGCDAFVADNPVFPLLRQTGKTGMRWRDISQDWGLNFANTLTAEEYLLPAGFKEGLTACLWTANGRYTGTVSVSWRHAEAATNTSRELIDNFRPVLAQVCDLLSKPATLAGAVAPDAHAVIVASNGQITDLPGRSTGPHLQPGGELHTILGDPAQQLDPGRFLWVDRDGEYHSADVIRCGRESVLVTERTVDRPSNLTMRELEILYHLCSGATNAHIAGQLVVSTKTVSTHVEHLLTKLECENRVQLTALAIEQGLRLLSERFATPA